MDLKPLPDAADSSALDLPVPEPKLYRFAGSSAALPNESMAFPLRAFDEPAPLSSPTSAEREWCVLDGNTVLRAITLVTIGV